MGTEIEAWVGNRGNGRGRGLAFDNGIDRTTLLTITAVDALGHVNVVARRPSTTVFALFGFDGDG